jgi:alpha-amylase/alpha-mannosidase (GH57 family)
LNPNFDSSNFTWTEKDKEIYQKVATKSYIPGIKMFNKLIKENKDFKITFSFSGTLIEQAKKYSEGKYDIIPLLQELYESGKTKNDVKEMRRVEFLDETYYHSLSGLFADPKKTEFREQVSKHGSMMLELFGERPTSFRNTELMYNNEIARTVADMGYKAILCEKRNDMFNLEGRIISPDAVFRAKDTNLIVLPRHRELSDDIAFKFKDCPITADRYAENISRISGEAVLLGYDFEHMGEHVWEDKGIFEFWKYLPSELAKHKNIVLANPSEIADRFKKVDCPVADVHPLSTSSWADEMRDTKGWIGNMTQYELFKEIENMEKPSRDAGGKYLENWKILTTSDTLYYLYSRSGIMDDGKLRLDKNEEQGGSLK